MSHEFLAKFGPKFARSLHTIHANCLHLQYSRESYEWQLRNLDHKNAGPLPSSARWTSECRSYWMRMPTWMRLTRWRLQHVSLRSRRPWPKPTKGGSEEKGRVCEWENGSWREWLLRMSSPSGTLSEWTQISSTRVWKTWPLDSSWTSLRYLATGNLYKSLAYGFWVIPNTIISVVLEVCHLQPLPQDSLQVSHNKRGVKGGSPGLQGQVELPSLLWLYRWKACEDASSISPWQSVLQLQRLLLHHHTGQLQVYVCGCGCLLCWLWCWLWCWNLQGVWIVSCGLYHVDCISRTKLVCHQVNPCQVVTLMSPASLLVMMHLSPEAGWWSHTSRAVHTCLVWGAKCKKKYLSCFDTFFYTFNLYRSLYNKYKICTKHLLNVCNIY